MVFVLAVCMCLASGFALVSSGWSRKRADAADLLLRLSLAAGFGLGIFSVIFYLSLIWHFSNLFLIDGIALAALIAAWLGVKLSRPSMPVRNAAAAPSVHSIPANNDDSCPAWLHRAVTLTFFAVLVIAAYAEIIRMLAFPHGDGWDAFTIWNLHARFLFLGGANWRDGFTALAGGSHPDYPLLLPASIAHFWTFLGHDDPRIPAGIGMIFTFANVGVLFAALSMLRGRMFAMMGAIALLSTPFFIEQGADQYADIPLSFFFLATVVLLCFFNFESTGETASRSPRFLILAGLAAGFAAWTKNEGLLFLLAIAVSRLVVFARAWMTNNRKSDLAFTTGTAPLLLALLPGLLLVMYYKHSIAVSGDLFSNSANALTKLFEPTRYWVIFAGYVKGFFRFGHWLWIPGTLLLLALLAAWGKNPSRTEQPAFRTSSLALTITLIGYFGVFLITPYDIHWHLRFSLVRLFLQLWPCTIFLVFLVLQAPPRPAANS